MWLVVAAMILWSGCDDSSNRDSGGLPILAGVWDMILIPAQPPDGEYTIVVEKSGGSGAAEVSITGPMSSNTATVVAGGSVALGSCGVWIAFGGTPEPGLFLAAGNDWRVLVSDGAPAQPVVGDTAGLSVSAVVSGGADDCGGPLCSGSALASALPAPAGAGGSDQGRQWLSVRLVQSGANVSASVAEQHVLSLDLATLPDDTVTVNFRRQVEADGDDGDFFRVIAVSGPSTPDAEYLWGDSLPAGDTTTTLTFESASAQARIDFIAGLSEQGEYALVDDVQVSSAALGLIFSGGFEAGPAPDCGPGGAPWSVREPAWTVGRLCVSANGALSGTYSARWEGGSFRNLSGSILTSASLSGLGSFMGGGVGGLLGGADVSSLAGVFMEAWEPVWTNYLTVFSVAEQSAGNLVGTFKGESSTHDCVEAGELVGSIHVTQVVDVSASPWIMRIDRPGLFRGHGV
jgi:hypothetical protein